MSINSIVFYYNHNGRYTSWRAKCKLVNCIRGCYIFIPPILLLLGLH